MYIKKKKKKFIQSFLFFFFSVCVAFASSSWVLVFSRLLHRRHHLLLLAMTLHGWKLVRIQLTTKYNNNNIIIIIIIIIIIGCLTSTSLVSAHTQILGRRLHQVHTNHSALLSSFLPRTISDWDHLPLSQLQSFRNQLGSSLHSLQPAPTAP